MKINNILPVLPQVLLNPFVIGVAVFIILYVNFCFYVARYRKKPPKPKVKKAAPAPAPAPAAENADGGEDAAPDSE